MEADGGCLAVCVPKGTGGMHINILSGPPIQPCREKSKHLAKPIFWGGFVSYAGKRRLVTPESPWGNEVLSTTGREHRYF